MKQFHEPIQPALKSDYLRESERQGNWLLMSSPSTGHFQCPRKTHLHAVTVFNENDEPVISMIQRGHKALFNWGLPDWSAVVKTITNN